MTAIESIRHDHLLIESMIEVLEAVVDRLDRLRDIDRAMLAGVVRFFAEYCAAHHVKQEAALFPLVIERCGAGSVPELGVLNQQHDEAERVLQAIRRAVDRLEHGTPADAISDVVVVGRRYAGLLRDHLRSEFEYLQRVAAPLLRPEDHAELRLAFERIERQRLGPTGREWYGQVVADYRDIVSTWWCWPDRRRRVEPGNQP